MQKRKDLINDFGGRDDKNPQGGNVKEVVVRYSDDELAAFEKKIKKKKKKATKSKKLLMESVEGNDFGKEVLSQQIELLQTTIVKCQGALVRVINKSFGIDFVTKKRIPIEILKANLFATRADVSKEEGKVQRNR